MVAAIIYMGEFPSGQRGQTVNLLLIASMVRIHPHPPLPFVANTRLGQLKRDEQFSDFKLAIYG